MSEIDELSRVIGQLESGIKMLSQKQQNFCTRLERLEKLLQDKIKKDNRASFYGGVIGGFVAIITFWLPKLVNFIWK